MVLNNSISIFRNNNLKSHANFIDLYEHFYTFNSLYVANSKIYHK